MKNRKVIITAVVLIISVGTYVRIISDGSIRTVEFLSIFAIGALTGVLLAHIFKKAG